MNNEYFGLIVEDTRGKGMSEYHNQQMLRKLTLNKP